MGWATWASQPSTVVGTAGSTGGVTLNTHLSQFDVDEATESFFGQFNNEKYEREGGVIGHSKSINITSHDMRTLIGDVELRAGTLWKDVKVTWGAEGASAGTGTFLNLTATIDQMLIESSGKGDSGGRLAINATARAISEDGSTDPITYAIA